MLARVVALHLQHEREVDRKDAIIQILDRDLEDSEEQYQMALRAHLLIVDKLIDLHNARLRGIEYDFEKDLQVLRDSHVVPSTILLHALTRVMCSQELRDEFGSERMEVDRSHAAHKKELLDIMAVGGWR